MKFGYKWTSNSRLDFKDPRCSV